MPLLVTNRGYLLDFEIIQNEPITNELILITKHELSKPVVTLVLQTIHASNI